MPGTEVIDKTGAKQEASPSSNDGAKLADSLKAAQDSAEFARKETESLRSMIEEKDSQLDNFQTKLAAFEEKLTEKGDGKKLSPTELAKVLRSQAQAGDKDSIAIYELMRETAREEFAAAQTETQFNSSLKQMDRFLDSKAKELNMKPEELGQKIDKFAAEYLDEDPHVRAELAYAKWQGEQSLATREAAVKARELELGLHKDPGTEGGDTTRKSGTDQQKSWRDAKTPGEKRGQLDDL